MTTKTTQADLGQVFDQFVEQVRDILTHGEQEVTKDGEVVRVTPKAATLNTIRQFLRDQNITASPDSHAGLKQLAKLELPFDPDEARGDGRTAH